VPIAHWQDFLSVPLLIGIALGIGTLSVFFEIAAQAMTTTLLKPQEFAEGNQKRYAGEAGAMVAGPGLAGALIGAVGPAMSLVVDAMTYLYSFFCLRKMRFVEPAPAAVAKEPMSRAIATGLREIGRNPHLRAITLASTALTFVFGIGGRMLIPFASRELGLSSQMIGISFSMLGVGALLGTLFVGRSVARFGLGRALIVGLLLNVPCYLLVAFAFGGPWLAASMLTVGLFVSALISPIYDVNQFSLRQAITPEPLRGRMVATTRVLIRGCAALGALTGGVVAELIGLRGAVFIGALAPILPVILLINSPIRSLKTIPIGPITAE
jgi:predicted MFS family arabinose efflux permease